MSPSPASSTVRVTLKLVDEFVRIGVCNDGEGISPQELPRIFDRFYRCDSNRSTPGTGLGLSIVKSVVEAHNGFVSIQSEPGGETRVNLSLPLHGVA